MSECEITQIKQHKHSRGLTLIELLISVSIFALIFIGFSSIDTFSRYHVLSSDRRAKLQNDASYVLEHMAKQIGQSIGDVNQTAVNASGIAGDTAIRAWIDYSQNGKRDTYPTDRQIAYRFRGATTGEIWYCPECTNNPCTQCNPGWGTSADYILSRKIYSFNPIFSSGNDYVEIQLTACWDPDGSPVACANPDNLALGMQNRIYMPSVSTH